MLALFGTARNQPPPPPIPPKDALRKRAERLRREADRADDLTEMADLLARAEALERQIGA
jgi:hypothetical protein